MSEILRNQRTVQVGAGDVQLLGPNRRRKSLLISAPAVHDVWVSFTGPATGSQGLPIHPGTTPVVLGHDDIGDAIHEEIRATCPGGTETITAVEIFT